ncbi:MAG TPA: A24 family peptidase [Kofleriaceae bacterium]|nr:A24 family peptidase [Kofleriaceae bacterium]
MPHIAILIVTAIAATTDLRTGLIPNWLTLPALVAAPAAHALFAGPGALEASLVGIALCGLPPYLLFRVGALGGGDVKLLAAIGGIAGASLGLEAQIFGLSVAAAYVIVRLAWRGGLLALLGRALRIVVNPLLPPSRRRPVATGEMMEMRLGASLFAGAVLAVLGQHGAWG